MQPLHITVLIENETSSEKLCCEHGLSLYLRYGEYNILLDAGQTGSFTRNTAALNCPLEGLHAAVLSHGHYDHADGFLPLFDTNKAIKVYARPAVLEPQYSGSRYIGLKADLIEHYADRFDLSDEQREILPGVWLVPDAVEHEQSLVVETAKGLVVMNSCCHAGGDNIVADILQRFPGQKVHALIGGLHLMGPQGITTLGKQPEEVRALAHRLMDELDVTYVYTGHCTGAPACKLLQEISTDTFRMIHTGDTLEF